MLFRLSEFGQVFSTRPRGLEVRNSLLAKLSPEDTVAVSFDSVLRVSQSFSDEFLGALISELGAERVQVQGPMAPAVERVLKRSLQHRGFDSLDEIGAVAA
jgi:hypothetical protein